MHLLYYSLPIFAGLHVIKKQSTINCMFHVKGKMPTYISKALKAKKLVSLVWTTYESPEKTIGYRKYKSFPVVLKYVIKR